MIIPESKRNSLTRIPFFNGLALLFVVFVLIEGCTSDRQQLSPNVLFILVDDLGWKDLGSYGSTFYDTPM